MQKTNLSVGVVGIGKLGRAIVAGLRKAGVEPRTYTRSDDQSQLGADCEVIFLCMRPVDVENYLRTQSHQFHEQHRLISVCAGVGLERLSAALGKTVPITYAVLNTAVENNQGICAFACDVETSVACRETWSRVFELLGQTFEIQESQSSTVMALAACTPAFFYDVTQALASAAAAQGLPPREATSMLAQVLKGAADMLEHSGKSALELKQQVATPGGVTEQGLNVLSQSNVSTAFAGALEASIRRIRGK